MKLETAKFVVMLVVFGLAVPDSSNAQTANATPIRHCHSSLRLARRQCQGFRQERVHGRIGRDADRFDRQIQY